MALGASKNRANESHGATASTPSFSKPGLRRNGVLLLTDFMPVRETHSDIVRMAECLEGRVTVQMELCVRFDYGRTIPWTGARERNAWAAAAGTGVAYLRTQQEIQTEDDIAIAKFILTRGERRSFVLTHADAQESPPRRINAQKALRQTEQFWKRWCASNTYDGVWGEAVERSLITLKALTYRPSGGIVAAPPLHCLNDSVETGIGTIAIAGCGTRHSLLNLYFLLATTSEARAWQEWFLQAVGSDVRRMQIMYGMRGERHLPRVRTSMARRLSKIAACSNGECGVRAIAVGCIR